ncbi:hypothetical protein Bbelb_116090 [Branchiostoma belcheri]|nr:hypothetical protein Bbelb_116090 [Branchiostoma belcheri]
MNCYRRLLQIHWSSHTTCTNEEVKQRVKSLAGPLPSFLSLVKKRKLQWFGHVARAKGKAEGGRLRGRLRRTWTSDLKEWTGHPLSHLTSLAENRPGWITLVDSLVAPTAGQSAMGPSCWVLAKPSLRGKNSLGSKSSLAAAYYSRRSEKNNADAQQDCEGGYLKFCIFCTVVRGQATGTLQLPHRDVRRTRYPVGLHRCEDIVRASAGYLPETDQ